jgi:hypothetical protein
MGVSKAAFTCTNAPVVGSFCLENRDCPEYWQRHCFDCAENWNGSAGCAAVAESGSSSGPLTSFLSSGKSARCLQTVDTNT